MGVSTRTRDVEDWKECVTSTSLRGGVILVSLQGDDNDAQDLGRQGEKTAYDKVKIVRRGKLPRAGR